MREDPATGILETDWVENRAAIPQGPIRRVIGRVVDQMYSSAYRDRYRMRLERGEKPGTTELFITHQGVEEIVQSDSDESETTKWGPRPQDPGIRAGGLRCPGPVGHLVRGEIARAAPPEVVAFREIPDRIPGIIGRSE